MFDLMEFVLVLVLRIFSDYLLVWLCIFLLLIIFSVDFICNLVEWGRVGRYIPILFSIIPDTRLYWYLSTFSILNASIHYVHFTIRTDTFYSIAQHYTVRRDDVS